MRLVKGGQSAGKGGRTADQPSSAEGRPAMVRSRPRPTRTELSIAAYNPNGRLAAGKIDGNGRVDEEAEVEHFR
ncbi:hypothetical protein DB347_08630 [Opitutaceae bacterium EW11]|nr:hypothetical protein DB347_08630 [Opitutaceae bacterium EW11]